MRWWWWMAGWALAWCAPLAAQTLAPLVQQPGTPPPAPWRLVALPPDKGIPPTRFATAVRDGEPALALQAQASYGTLVHPWQGPLRTLQWRWQLEQPLAAADLRSKAGDDVALKVCVLFDMPLAVVPWRERAALALARTLSGEALPAATLCYVWDTTLSVGTLLPNAYSARVRYMVLDHGPPQPGWQIHRRDISADFLSAFGGESAVVPPVAAIAVGADADNTRGRSLGWIAGLQALP